MEIVEYALTITQRVGEEDISKTLIYRKNENIIIRYETSDDDEAMQLSLPRHVLESFMEMIKI